MQLQELAADRGDRVDHPARRVDRGAVAHHALGEHRVGDVLERNRAPRDRGEDRRLAHCRLLCSCAPTIRACPQDGLNFARSRLSFRSASAAGRLRQRRVTGNERHGETSRGNGKVGSAHSRLRAVAAAGQEPHAADRGAARGRHPAAAGPARPAGRDQGPGDRAVLRGDERGRRRAVRQPAAAVRRRRRHRLRQEGRRFDRAGRRRRATW